MAKTPPTSVPNITQIAFSVMNSHSGSDSASQITLAKQRVCGALLTLKAPPGRGIRHSHPHHALADVPSEDKGSAVIPCSCRGKKKKKQDMCKQFGQ